ncbi:MAG TPA: sulfur carrier protein ThiS [Acidobacteriota bacterium]|nr:sulfur carrier protein ThiS [Acidobacteriota bacterium]HQF87409.1 sulfur carrier protein ThiS [Acidobacteriota bacterium]HQG91983.1 sulfur carrier protein ThiS [Acidobacteriota bacterium]HQK88623.1 sulfur carrier protein ThiS [Acidobacteriota bacterium]
MRLIINNRETDLTGSQLTVRQMLQQMKYTFPMIFVRVNGDVIRKDQYDSFVIRDGDRVDAIHLMGGG